MDTPNVTQFRKEIGLIEFPKIQVTNCRLLFDDYFKKNNDTIEFLKPLTISAYALKNFSISSIPFSKNYLMVGMLIFTVTIHEESLAPTNDKKCMNKDINRVTSNNTFMWNNWGDENVKYLNVFILCILNEQLNEIIKVNYITKNEDIIGTSVSFTGDDSRLITYQNTLIIYNRNLSKFYYIDYNDDYKIKILFENKTTIKYDYGDINLAIYYMNLAWDYQNHKIFIPFFKYVNWFVTDKKDYYLPSYKTLIENKQINYKFTPDKTNIMPLSESEHNEILDKQVILGGIYEHKNYETNYTPFTNVLLNNKCNLHDLKFISFSLGTPFIRIQTETDFNSNTYIGIGHSKIETKYDIQICSIIYYLYMISNTENRSLYSKYCLLFNILFNNNDKYEENIFDESFWSDKSKILDNDIKLTEQNKLFNYFKSTIQLTKNIDTYLDLLNDIFMSYPIFRELPYKLLYNGTKNRMEYRLNNNMHLLPIEYQFVFTVDNICDKLSNNYIKHYGQTSTYKNDDKKFCAGYYYLCYFIKMVEKSDDSYNDFYISDSFIYIYDNDSFKDLDYLFTLNFPIGLSEIAGNSDELLCSIGIGDYDTFILKYKKQFMIDKCKHNISTNAKLTNYKLSALKINKNHTIEDVCTKIINPIMQNSQFFGNPSTFIKDSLQNKQGGYYDKYCKYKSKYINLKL